MTQGKTANLTPNESGSSYENQAKDTKTNRENLKDFAADVEAVLDRKEALGDIFDTLQRAHIAGEPVQSELNDIFEGFPELVRVVGTGETDKLENFLEHAVEVGILKDETRDEFEEFWTEISWISPGVRAYLFEERGNPSTWTEDEIDIYSAGYGPAVEYVYLNGVDEDYRLRAPLPVFYNETIERLQYIVGWVAAAVSDGDVDESTLQVVRESQPILQDAVHLLDSIPDSLAGERSSLQSGGEGHAGYPTRDEGERSGDENPGEGTPDGIRGFQ